MKKTLLSVAFALAVNLGFAQQTISFETSEGFTEGNINTQNGWTTTSTDAEGTTFVENQVVSSEEFSNGSNSFKLTTEAAFPGQTNPVVGGFYTLASPVARQGATVSFDFKITDGFNLEGNDYRFALTGPDPADALFTAALVQIRFNGNIAGVDNASQFANLGPLWTENVWFNVKMEFAGNQVEYFVDGVSLATYNVLTEVDFTGFRIVHDNYGGTAYIDNIKINDEVLSNESVFSSNYEVYPNPATDVINVNAGNLQINAIQITDLNGRIVKNITTETLTSVQVDIQDLNAGLYMMSVFTNEGVGTSKIVKK